MAQRRLNEERLGNPDKPRVGEQTFANYEWLLNRVTPKLGKTRLTQLCAEDIQKFYGTQPTSTARHIHAPLRSALSQAVKWHLIYANPCDSVELPRHKTRETQWLTREEAGRFLAIEGKYSCLFAFLLDTGARPSEALGLKWPDINLDTGTVTIQRTLQWRAKGGYYFAETKTKGSRRTVPLGANMARRIREHRGIQAERLLKIGVRSELVFSNTEGEPILRRNLARRHFKPALKSAKLPTNLSLYCLRHTCASLLLQAGIHPKVVAERLGHSSTKLTLDIYSHIAPGMQSEAATRLDQLLYG